MHKHCDRVTRRKRLVTTSLGADPEPPTAVAGPERTAEEREAADRLRLAVESLPVAERQVVALHYFAEATGSELAEFLEVPLATIKKRLRTARVRLRDEGERLMQNTIDRLKPSASGDLSREVSFFIALRAGDLEEVRRLLTLTPELVDAQQAWDSELVRQGLLPFANKATALITAIEQDNLAMLRLLLDAGANVDGACGCVTGESPLWAAALLDRPHHARLLLERWRWRSCCSLTARTRPWWTPGRNTHAIGRPPTAAPAPGI
ncbi:MAG: sigma-70 family RNA polymerase sigma factor [Gammaproteobacteria bacterium]